MGGRTKLREKDVGRFFRLKKGVLENWFLGRTKEGTLTQKLH